MRTGLPPPSCRSSREGRGSERETRCILIFVYSPSKLACKVNASLRHMSRPNRKTLMKVTMAAATLLVGALSAGATQPAQASPGSKWPMCIAKVLYSEELPFAAVNHWLVTATLEITPPNGRAYEMTLQDTMPLQAPPPRRGQAFRLRCDPANPADLHSLH